MLHGEFKTEASLERTEEPDVRSVQEESLDESNVA
jgi:hypothetical protein